MLDKHRLSSILEAGSGSGKATLLLDKKFKKTLLDISPNALKYARILSRKFKTGKPKTIQVDIFSMPFNSKSFDFVWNIGVIEHYSDKDIVFMLREMIRVCREQGIVAIGIPNFYSGPILKAALLRLRILSFIPGYRLDTERFLKVNKLNSLLKKAAKQETRSIESLNVMYFGSPLIMETPQFIFGALNPLVSFFLPKNRFLMLVVCKFKDKK